MSGIYIHFPFCIHKCSYCDFYSIENLNGRDSFIDSLCKEIELRSAAFSEKSQISTFFIGGGTPSLISPENMEKIMTAIQRHYAISDDAELTLECNPGAADREHFEEYRLFGFNRMSIGVQSFVQKELDFLERIHQPSDAIKAFRLAREAGFDNLSLDLMFAIPGQTLNSWSYSLSQTIELMPDHISAYSLIYEPGTPLYKKYEQGKLIPTSEETDLELYAKTNEKLSKVGFHQYEVSNYAQNGKECQHNLNYWKGGSYIAFGPSAHGYDGIERYWNVRSNFKYKRYLESGKLPLEGSEKLSLKEKIFEKIYLGLRAKGLDLREFNYLFGIDLAMVAAQDIREFIDIGFIIKEDEKLKLTNAGYFNNDTITVELMNSVEKCI